MLSNCPKCGSSQEVKLRVTRDKAGKIDGGTPQCTKCGTAIEMSKYTVGVMISNKDIIEDASNKVPFGVECDKCNKTVTALYDRKKKRAVCGGCRRELNVSKFMLKALEESRQYADNEEQKEAKA